MKPSLKKALREAYRRLPPEAQEAFKKFGKAGGRSRAKRMTAEQRREAARKAVQARWTRAKKP